MERFIYNEVIIPKISTWELDTKLSEGWRHFGERFFRYSMSIYEGEVCTVMPLRINLNRFMLSKTYKKIVRKNEHFTSQIQPAIIDAEKVRLFENHKRKFDIGTPESLYDFLSTNPAKVPNEGKELNIFDGDKLIATSFFDITSDSISSIYGMFDLEYEKQSLGIYTMLLEIAYASLQKKNYYYHGYAYDIPSFYDYKKKFEGLEYYNWKRKWLPLERLRS